MSVGPVTAFIEDIPALFDAIETRLNTSVVFPTWNVVKYAGTSVEALFQMMPELTLPAAVIAYSDSRYYDDRQRRNSIWHVIAINKAPNTLYTQGLVTSMAILKEVINLLDWRIVLGNAKMEVVSDDALDFGPTLSAFDIQFIIKDH